jgi:hypothetical protein
MSGIGTVEGRALRQRHRLVITALDHALTITRLMQEQTEGTEDTFRFEAVARGLIEFRDHHPAMRDLSTAAFADAVGRNQKGKQS